MKTTSSIDFAKLADKTLAAMGDDAGFPEEFQSAVIGEIARRKKAGGLLPEGQRGLAASFSAARDPDRLVKNMEKRAERAKAGRP